MAKASYDCNTTEIGYIRQWDNRQYRHDDHYRTYAVTFSDGTKMSVIKWALSKLPPKQGTTTWEDIQQITGWVPNKQGVES